MLKEDIKSNGERSEYSIVLNVLDGVAGNISLGCFISFQDWRLENYVLYPAAVYNGNRFESLPRRYPHMFTPEERGVNIVNTISDVPRLSFSGKSMLNFVAGDMSTPASGIFLKENSIGVWLTAPQRTSDAENGLEIYEDLDNKTALMGLSFPCVKQEYQYTIANRQKAPSEYCGITLEAGDSIKCEFSIHTFECGSIQALFDKFISVRSDFAKNTSICILIAFYGKWSIVEI